MFHIVVFQQSVLDKQQSPGNAPQMPSWVVALLMWQVLECQTDNLSKEQLWMFLVLIKDEF